MSFISRRGGIGNREKVPRRILDEYLFEGRALGSEVLRISMTLVIVLQVLIERKENQMKR